MMNELATKKRPMASWQFRISALLLTTVAFAVMFALLSAKIGQDRARHNALFELQSLGLNHSLGDKGTKFFAIANEIDSTKTDRIISLLEILEERYDLGLSAGHTVQEIDLGNASVSDDLIVRLQQAFPDAHLKQSKSAK